MMNHSVTLSKTMLLSKNIQFADLGALIAAPGEKLSGDSQNPTQLKFLCLSEKLTQCLHYLFLVPLKLI